MIRRILLLCAANVLYLAVTSSAQTLPYILEKPVQFDPAINYPLVICLHGAGGRGSDNQGRGIKAYQVLRDDKNKKKYPAFLLVPQCPEGKQWVNTPWKDGSYSIDAIAISDQLQFVSDLIDSILTVYPIDKSRIYLTGQSMGGYGTWDLSLRRSELFAAIIPVCGGGDPSKAKALKGMGVWIFHGDADPTVPVSGSRDMYKALKKTRMKNLLYSELKDVGHNSWENAWNSEATPEWLFRQRRPK